MLSGEVDPTSYSVDARDMELIKQLGLADRSMWELEEAERKLAQASMDRNSAELNARERINSLPEDLQKTFRKKLEARYGLNGNYILPAVQVEPVDILSID